MRKASVAGTGEWEWECRAAQGSVVRQDELHGEQRTPRPTRVQSSGLRTHSRGARLSNPAPS